MPVTALEAPFDWPPPLLPSPARAPPPVPDAQEVATARKRESQLSTPTLAAALGDAKRDTLRPGAVSPPITLRPLSIASTIQPPKPQRKIDGPLPELPDEGEAAPRSPTIATSKSTRSFTLAAPAPGGAFLRRGDGSGRVLINPSTAGGTINRRRKGPSITEMPSPSFLADLQPSPSPLIPRTIESPSMGSLGLDRTSSFDLAPKQAEPLGQARMRALSQPGRRPSLPVVPLQPVPPIMRKASAPAPAVNVVPPDRSRSHSPASSIAMAPSLSGASVSTSAGYESETPSTSGFSKMGAISGAEPPPTSEAAPVSRHRASFQLMGKLRAAITTGAYITPKLYVPKSVWTQAGVKLTNVELKIRMLELVVAGLETCQVSADAVLHAPPMSGSAVASSLRSAASTFAKELETLESLLDEVAGTLGKKLGSSDALKSKRSGQLGTWSSKLSRSFDRMTTNKGCVGEIDGS